jgi:geranylgeranyl diphosphate synthase, type I
MKTGSTTPGPVTDRVAGALAAFLGRQRDTLLAAGEDLAPVADTVTGLLGGGKRLRPAFCYWGWRGAGGPDTPGIVTAAASLELLHAGALVHDDLIDSSDTRRGGPSVHRQFAARHAAHGWRGPAGAFGTGAAILLGDLLLSWAGEMYHGSGLAAEALQRGQPVLDRMRTEVFAGQYLDLLEQSAGQGTVASALRVTEYKTAKYTVERPLELGAALAGAVDGPLPAAYSGYGLPLGIAFQLRDDILGVFGDPALTGKPAGDDLREGKHTVLLALTREKATASQAAAIERHLGDPRLDEAGTAEARSVIAATGALAECEAMIERHVSRAVAALAGAPVSGEARQALTDLAVAATARLA